MKKFWIPLLLFVLCATMTLSVSAAGTISRLTDAADLLTDEEEAALLADLDLASDRAQFDIVVITLTTLEGTDVEEAARQLYDNYQFGYGEGDEKTYDGALFLISMEERETAIDAYGVGQYILDLSAQDAIFEEVIPYLSEGNYYEGFETFAAMTEHLVIRVRETGAYDNYYDDPAAWGPVGEPSDDGYAGYDGYVTPVKSSFSAGSSILIGFFISLVLATIVTSSMKSQLKTVRQQNAAANYVKRDSLNLTESRENYLYSNVTRIPKATANNRPANRPTGGSRPSGGSFRPSSGGHTSSSHKF